MKVYQSNEIKNIALLGNDGAGKTTLTEALLYEAGLISRRGRITQKNTVSDYFPVEQEYGYSVFSTVYHVEWNNKKLNIIDCPGSDDFVGAAMTALNVTDTAILLLNGQYGPEVGTQNHFRYTEKLGKPVIFLVNQLDSDKCDYANVLERLTEIYGPKVVPVQYPLNEGGIRCKQAYTPSWHVVALAHRVEFDATFLRSRHIEDAQRLLVQDEAIWIVVHDDDVLSTGKIH